LADLAHGRSSAWNALGDLARAVSYQEEAVRDAPQVTSLWLQLANLYDRQGRLAEAQRARARAAQTELPPPGPIAR
jgi:Flp pilus assembly protein TadD